MIIKAKEFNITIEFSLKKKSRIKTLSFIQNTSQKKVQHHSKYIAKEGSTCHSRKEDDKDRMSI